MAPAAYPRRGPPAARCPRARPPRQPPPPWRSGARLIRVEGKTHPPLELSPGKDVPTAPPSRLDRHVPPTAQPPSRRSLDSPRGKDAPAPPPSRADMCVRWSLAQNARERVEGKTHPPRRLWVAAGGLSRHARPKETPRAPSARSCASRLPYRLASPLARLRLHWPVSLALGRGSFFARSFRCSSPAERERAAHSGPASLAVAEPLRPPCAGTAAETTIRNQSPSSKIAAVRANGGPGSRLEASLV